MKKERTTKRLNILIIAGESSGDNLGSLLMKELKKNPSYEFFFWGTGGDNMEIEGLHIIKNIRDLEAIGLEVIFRYGFFIRLIKRITKAAVKNTDKQIFDKDAKPLPGDYEKTNLAILIDYPGFNLRLAQNLAKNNIPVIFFVAPQVWAWHYSRVKKMKLSIQLLLLLFFFEKKIFDKEGIPNHYVGHPIAYSLKEKLSKERPILRQKSKKQKILTLMPGSRNREITALLPVFAELAQKIRKSIPGLRILVAYNNREMERYIVDTCNSFDLEPVYNRTLRCIEAADLVVLSSGTATLEVALLKKPMLIAYKVKPLTYHIMKRLIKISYIGLVNIIAEKFIVPEFIQKEVTSDKMAGPALDLLKTGSAKRKNMIKELEKIRKQLESKNPSQESAKAIFKFIKDKLLG